MDDELALASATEQGSQGLAEGYPFQPQNLAQQGQIAADIRARQQRPMGMGGGVGPLSAYTNSDNLQAQRLANGLSQTSNLVASGELTPEEGQQYQQQIQSQLGPLQQKQSRAQAQQMQQSVHQAMQASALQAGIEAVNMKARAQAFPSTTSVYTDPESGESEHFYQKKPGEWHEVQFTRHEAEKDRMAQSEAGAPPEEPQPEYNPLGLNLAIGQADKQPPIQETSPTSHIMTIQNGAHIQKFQYDRGPNGWSSKLVADNRPLDTVSGNGLTGDNIQEISRRADEDYLQRRGPYPSWAPQNSAQAHLLNQQQRDWEAGRRENQAVWARSALSQVKIKAAAEAAQQRIGATKENIQAGHENRMAEADYRNTLSQQKSESDGAFEKRALAMLQAEPGAKEKGVPREKVREFAKQLRQEHEDEMAAKKENLPGQRGDFSLVRPPSGQPAGAAPTSGVPSGAEQMLMERRKAAAK